MIDMDSHGLINLKLRTCLDIGLSLLHYNYNLIIKREESVDFLAESESKSNECLSCMSNNFDKSM